MFSRIIFLWTRQIKKPITPVFFQQLWLCFSLQVDSYVGGWKKVCVYTQHPRQYLETNLSAHGGTNEASCNCLKSKLLYEISFTTTVLIKYKRKFFLLFLQKAKHPRKNIPGLQSHMVILISIRILIVPLISMGKLIECLYSRCLPIENLENLNIYQSD